MGVYLAQILIYILTFVIDRLAWVSCPPRIVKVEGISREFVVRNDLCRGWTLGVIVVVFIVGVFKLLRALYLLYR